MYGARLQLAKADDDTQDEMIPVDPAAQSENLELVKQVVNNNKVIQATSTSNLKHAIKYFFSDLTKGKYYIRVIQPSKTTDCVDMLTVYFRPSLSMNALLSIGSSSNQRVHYMSK